MELEKTIIKKIQELISNMKDLDPEFVELVNENFGELLLKVEII